MYTISILPTCTQCRRCMHICPEHLFSIEREQIRVVTPEHCIECGHCVGVCASEAIVHSSFPAERIHAFSYDDYPSAEALMTLLRARRSNRAFLSKQIPPMLLDRLVEAALLAPTASNQRQLRCTVITDPNTLRCISRSTLWTFRKMSKLLSFPLIKPIVSLFAPDVAGVPALYQRMKKMEAKREDLILRGATAVLLFSAPASNRFGCEDANLAYQNASLMAETLGLAHFYTGFVLAASKQDRSLGRRLGVDGVIYAGMALAPARFRFSKYVDRERR